MVCNFDGFCGKLIIRKIILARAGNSEDTRAATFDT